jgi:glycine cleavage system H lipoate-binding protein/ABC-type phosphate transport system substrate-binding protein
MKTKIVTSAVILLILVCGSVKSQEVSGTTAAKQTETLTISCTSDLFPITSQWANVYRSLKPEVKINVSTIEDKSINQGEGDDLRIVTNNPDGKINEKDWKMVVGRDVIVPIMNSGNPFLIQLMQQGISPEKFAKIFNNPDKQNWGALLADGQNAVIHIYVVNDESVKNGIAKFLKSKQIPSTGIIVGTKDEVISAIQKDPTAIGFCKVVNVIEPDNQSLVANIKMLPIDKNGNGTIDYMEDIYTDVNAFLRGVWIGKYPKALYSNIYAVSKVQPANETEMAFLSWIITDGQQFMNSNGYCALVNTESQAQLNKISTAIVSVSPATNTTRTGLILLIMALVITMGVVITAGVRRYRKQAPAIPDFNDSLTGFNENSIEVPKGIYFNRSHSWAFMEKDGNVSIGIDDFLQHVTGPLTRVEMRNAGEKVKKGELLFSIVQFGKRLSLYSPISGIIKQQNETLIQDASKINSSPYSDGWIYRIEPSNWFVEVNFMDMADKYKKWINTEFSRMKDFLAATLKPDSLEYSHVVLQDGGIVKEGVLADFGPEVWDDFQTNFLEIYK